MGYHENSTLKKTEYKIRNTTSPCTVRFSIVKERDSAATLTMSTDKINSYARRHALSKGLPKPNQLKRSKAAKVPIAKSVAATTQVRKRPSSRASKTVKASDQPDPSIGATAYSLLSPATVPSNLLVTAAKKVQRRSKSSQKPTASLTKQTVDEDESSDFEITQSKRKSSGKISKKQTSSKIPANRQIDKIAKPSSK